MEVPSQILNRGGPALQFGRTKVLRTGLVKEEPEVP